MSEEEYWAGKLIPVEMLSSTEDTCKKICKEHGWVLDAYYDSWREVLEEEGYKDYCIVDSKIFKVEADKEDPCGDIYKAKFNEDGTYDFVLKFYNGGCSFTEAIEEALYRLKNDK